MRQGLGAAALVLLLMLAVLPAVQAALQATGEVAVADSNKTESGARVAVDDDGNFHLVYYESTDTTFDVVYKKLSPRGDELYAMTGVGPSDLASGITWMEIAVDGSATSHIVFATRLENDDVDDIFYTQISNSGATLVPVKRVFTSGNTSSLPHLDVDGSGSACIVWAEGGGSPGIYWMRVSSAGVVVGDARTVNGDLGFNGNVQRPRIGVNALGTSFIVWEQQNTPLNRWEIYYTSLSSTGEVSVQPLSVVANSRYDANQVHADLDSKDRLHITYVINDNAMYSIVDPSGGVELSGQTIADPMVGNAIAPDVCVDPEDNAFTAYQQRDTPTSNWNVYVRKRGVDDDGWGSEVMLNPENRSSIYPRMGAGPMGVGVVYQSGLDLYWNLVTEGVSTNTPPVAVLESSATSAEINETVLFNGNSSYDPDPQGAVVQYWFKWGDDGDTGWINASNAEHAYNAPGTYTVSLWVKDDEGAESENADTVKITVTEGGTTNQAPTAVLTADKQAISVGDVVMFDGSASSDPEGYVAEYYFDYGDGKNSDWTDTPQKSHKYASVGEYKATLLVKDDEGEASKNTAYVYINVSKVNTAPTAVVEFIDPNPAKEGEKVVFSGYGMDDDDLIVEYEWKSSRDGKLSSQKTFETASLSVGTHTITFRVKDARGAWSDDNVQDLLVNPNEKPVLEDYTEPSSADTEELVQFRVRYTDPENDRPMTAKVMYKLGEQTWSEPLTPEDLYDDDVTDGKDYNADVEFLEEGTYVYWFEFENAENGVVKSPETDFEVNLAESTPGYEAALLILGAFLLVLLVSALPRRRPGHRLR